VPAVLVVGLAGCGNDDKSASPATTRATRPAAVAITAREYAFDVPASIAGGVVSLRFTNSGNEPHFAGIVRLAPGRTAADAMAFFSGPPSGPPPFEEVGGLPTTDPQGTGNQQLVLEPGSYALFCTLPAPDGVPHTAKGMVAAFTVTEATGPASLPATGARITGRDFAFSDPPAFTAGDNTVTLANEGSQLHEINLVELPPGKTLDDLRAWFGATGGPAGPPPARFLSGAAIKPGAATTTRLTLEAGHTYALICAIPDPSDGKPHVLKGMATGPFTVS
jgi:plastocyanin